VDYIGIDVHKKGAVTCPAISRCSDIRDTQVVSPAGTHRAYWDRSPAVRALADAQNQFGSAKRTSTSRADA
jgi:hypothetical protein